MLTIESERKRQIKGDCVDVGFGELRRRRNKSIDVHPSTHTCSVDRDYNLQFFFSLRF
jgi:hypothetical protein